MGRISKLEASREGKAYEKSICKENLQIPQKPEKSIITQLFPAIIRFYLNIYQKISIKRRSLDDL